MTRDIAIKRAYEPPRKADGTRVLVDRLWPRGISREALMCQAWMKEIAPSAELRKWFNHDPARWEEFRTRYEAELRGNAQAVAVLLQTGKARKLTLVYGARDELHNQARVLAEYLRKQH